MVKKLFAMLMMAVVSMLLVTSFAYAHENHAACGAMCVQGQDCDLKNHNATQDAGHYNSDSWQLWDGTTQIVVSNGETKFYYLDKNVTVEKSILVNEGGSLRFCLNGYTLTMDADADILVMNPKTHVTICDCSATQTGAMTHATGRSGRAVYANGQYGNLAKIQVYGGKYYNHTAPKGENGAAFFLNRAPAKFYNCEISSNYGDDNCGAIYITNPYGYTTSSFFYAGVNVKNNVNIGGIVAYCQQPSKRESGQEYHAQKIEIHDGCEISGNSATYGGGIAIYGETSLGILGGEIANNTATYGGGVYVGDGVMSSYSMSIRDYPYLSMSKGVIKNNKATEGGGIYNKGQIHFNTSYGSAPIKTWGVMNNTADYGGGIHSNYGSIFFYNANISNNSAKYAGGGILYGGAGETDNSSRLIFQSDFERYIRENTVAGKENNIHLGNGNKIWRRAEKFGAPGASIGVTVNMDSTGSYTFLDGYRDSYFLDGVEASELEFFYSDQGYAMTAENTDTEISLEGVMKAAMYELALKSSPTQAGQYSGAGTYLAGTKVTVTATANTDYSFFNWTENDKVVSTEASYSFNMPVRDVELTANFIVKHVHAPCGDASCTDKHPTHTSVDYIPVSKFVDLKLTSGNNYFYLTEDINMERGVRIEDGQSLFLCLNGHSMGNYDSYVFCIMEGGKLVLCDCKDSENSILTTHYYGQGMVVSGTAEMYGGNIFENTANKATGITGGGGVYVDGGSFTLYDGAITKNAAGSTSVYARGGGVCVTNNGRFTMHGGTISGNTSINNYGGGIYKDHTGTNTVIITGGTIENNTADYGGGIAVFENDPSSSFADLRILGGTIRNNTANKSGGGVYNYYSRTEVTGGSITNNKYGGIHNESGILVLSDCTITGNSSNGGGGVGTNNSRVFVSGNVIVIGNTDNAGNTNNLYLPIGHVLNVSSNLTGDLGIYTAKAPAKNAPVRYLKPVNGYTLTASDLAHTAADRTGTYFVKNIDHEGYGIFGNMQYKVTVSNDGNGTGTANYTLAESGTEITLTPSAKEGYTFKEWQVVKGDVTVANNKFTMGSADVEIKAVFEAVNPDYTVSITTPNNGTVTADVATAKAGATVTLTVTPNVGYVVDSVKYNDTTITPVEGVYSFTMPAANVTVTATFKPISPVANVDGIDYTNFADAVNAWQQSTAKTMTLLEDAALDEANIDVIELLSGDKVLDLNGCSLSNKSGSVLYITNFVSMEIMDSDGGGVIAGTGDNATIQTVIGSLRITGGTIESDHCAIYNDNSGSLNISGNTVIRNTHATNPAIISTGGLTILDKVIIDAEVDISIERTAHLENAENCAGWHVTGKSDSLFLPTNYYLMTAVSNGTYVADLSKVDSAYIVAHEHKYTSNSGCACGAPAVASVAINGTTTYYGTLYAAASACENGSTLTLLQDVTVTASVSLNKSVTFDLGGKTLTGKENGYLIISSACTIQNGNIAIWGSANSAVSVDADLRLYNCSVVNNNYNYGIRISSDDATVILEDCTINAETASILTDGAVPVIKQDVILRPQWSILFEGPVSGIDLKDANQPEYTVRFGYQDANCSGLDLNNDAYEFVHKDGTLVSAENPIKYFEAGIVRLKHVHSWSYEANGNTITAKCTGNIGTCPDSEQTISVVAPAVLVYSGDEKTAAIEGSIEGVELPAITYNNVDRTKVTGNEIEASIQLGMATASVQYTIEAASIEAAQITVANQIYTGEAITPEIATVKLGEKTLVKDTDYTVEYTDNINVGEATVTVTGKGNYAGTVEAKFQISKSDADVAAKSYLGETEQSAFFYGDVITVKGSAAVAQTFALRAPTDKAQLYFNSILLAEGDVSGNSFTLSYDTTEKKLPVGTYPLTVEFGGNGNLNGKAVTVTVTLNKADVSAPTGLSATYGQTLADITLPTVDNGVWSWKEDNTTQVGNAGEQTYVLVFTPNNDSSFVNVAEVNANITVSPLELKGVTAPSDVELTSYHATAEEVKNQLPATITVTGADNKTYKLPVTWTWDSFNDQPNSESTFTWTVDLGSNFTATDVATTGNITVTNGSALSVTITGTNQETTYNGNSYKVSGMFTIDPNAGAATYAIVEGGTGAGTLEGSMLTITKAGTITIKVSTAQKLPYAAGEASATLTVNKGELSVEPLTNLTAVYGDTLSAVALPENWAWKTPETKVGDVGDRVHMAVYNTDPNLWNDKEVSLTIKVNKASIQMDASAKTFLGEVEQTTFTYGDVITVKVTPVMPMLLSDELVAPAPNQMALFYGSQQISSPVDAVNGTYTMEYATTDKVLPTGESKLTVRYVGNGNTNDASSDLPVTISQAELVISNVTVASRKYQPGSMAVTVEDAVLDGVYGNDDVSVETPLHSTIDKADAGTYTEILLPEMINLKGTAALYYKVKGGVRITAEVTIIKAELTPTGTPNMGEVEPGTSLGDVPTDPIKELFKPVEGTVTWKDPAETPVEAGKEYEWTFTPTDPNYDSVNGSVVLIPKTSFSVTVVNGTGSGEYEEGETVTITANAPATGKQFAGWTSDDVSFVNGNEATTTFVMPGKAVSVTATYENIPPVEPAKYTVTVVNGTGSGEYEEGETVTITANAPATGKQFAGWTSNEVTFVNANATTTSFTMPAKVVTVVANYIDVPVSVHYTVVYNANGGTGAMANQYFNYGETKALLTNVFTREGYTFKGWNTKSDGTGTAYADGQVVTMYNAAILYAQWMHVEAPDVPAPTPTPNPVVTPLEITQQPADQMVAPGEKAQFSIEASGDEVAYQWYINRNNGRGWVKLQGATNAVHETSVADLAYDGFQYVCEVRDMHGNALHSNVAVLYVVAQPDIPETGDEANVTLLCALMMISGLGCLMLMKKRQQFNQ